MLGRELFRRFWDSQPINSLEAVVFSYIWMAVGLAPVIVGGALAGNVGMLIGGVAGVSVVKLILEDI
jgi:hypothetical protein